MVTNEALQRDLRQGLSDFGNAVSDADGNALRGFVEHEEDVEDTSDGAQLSITRPYFYSNTEYRPRTRLTYNARPHEVASVTEENGLFRHQLIPMEND